MVVVFSSDSRLEISGGPRGEERDQSAEEAAGGRAARGEVRVCGWEEVRLEPPGHCGLCEHIITGPHLLLLPASVAT